MVGEGAAVLVARAFEAARFPRPADALQQFVDIYAARLLVHTRAYEGIPDVLAALGESRASRGPDEQADCGDADDPRRPGFADFFNRGIRRSAATAAYARKPGTRRAATG